MRIRKVKSNEIIEVLKFIAETFPNSNISISENDTIYLATENKEIVGFMHTTEEPDKVLLNGIGTRKEDRGKMVGTKLMNYLVNKIKNKPIFLKVKDKNFVAQKLYHKFGFIPKKFGEVYILVKQPEN